MALSMWLRPPEGTGQILELIPDVPRAMAVVIAVSHSRLKTVFGETMDTRKKELSTELDGGSNGWFHVALMVDGVEASLWVNGENRGVISLDGNPSLPVANRYSLRIGHDQRATTSSDDFAIDDVRVWRRLLDGDVVRSLSIEDDPPLARIIHEEAFPWPWESEMVYRLAEGRYHQEDDLLEAVQGEFGPGAKAGDWDNIKRAVGPWPTLWAELSGFFEGGAQLLRGGHRAFSEKRNYEMSRLNGNMPRFFLAHAQVGNRDLALGSWTSSPPMMAEIPTGERYHVLRHEGAAISERIVGVDLGGGEKGASNRYEYSPKYEPGDDLARRIWVFELPPEFDRWNELSLAIGDRVEVFLRQQERRRWDLGFKESADATPYTRTVIMAAKAHWWVVVQSQDRLYQMLAEGTEKTVLQELVADGIVDDVSLDSPWKVLFSDNIDVTTNDGIASAHFPSLVHVDESTDGLNRANQ